MAKVILVPTPVGNLEDITFRAVRILKEADLIAAEDTRQTIKLLRHYGIETPMTSLHAHNEHKKTPELLQQILNNDQTLAIVTDAGTPGISDPGFLAAREAIAMEIPLETLPGATAFVPALVNSGLPCDKFHFEGFLPPKKGRKTRLDILKECPDTMVIYESPHRIVKTIEEFVGVFGGERKVSIAREISKLHEEHIRGTLEEVLKDITQRNIKGEIVIVLAGSK